MGVCMLAHATPVLCSATMCFATDGHVCAGEQPPAKPAPHQALLQRQALSKAKGARAGHGVLPARIPPAHPQQSGYLAACVLPGRLWQPQCLPSLLTTCHAVVCTVRSRDAGVAAEAFQVFRTGALPRPLCCSGPELHAREGGRGAFTCLAECRAQWPFPTAEGGPPLAPGGTGRFGALDAVDEGAHEPNFEAFHVTSADEIEAAVAQVRPCAWPCRGWAEKDCWHSWYRNPLPFDALPLACRAMFYRGCCCRTHCMPLCASIAAGGGLVVALLFEG